MSPHLSTVMKMLKVLEDRSMFDRDQFLPYDLREMLDELCEVMDDYDSAHSDESYSIGYEDGKDAGYDDGYESARDKVIEALNY
jgi:hypothetical protein